MNTVRLPLIIPDRNPNGSVDYKRLDTRQIVGGVKEVETFPEFLVLFPTRDGTIVMGYTGGKPDPNSAVLLKEGTYRYSSRQSLHRASFCIAPRLENNLTV